MCPPFTATTEASRFCNCPITKSIKSVVFINDILMMSQRIFNMNNIAKNINRTCNLATLSQLHWLPVHDRIKFKTATMTRKALSHRYPPISG